MSVVSSGSLVDSTFFRNVHEPVADMRRYIPQKCCVNEIRTKSDKPRLTRHLSISKQSSHAFTKLFPAMFCVSAGRLRVQLGGGGDGVGGGGEETNENKIRATKSRNKMAEGEDTKKTIKKGTYKSNRYHS
jgi:hypothetical protein